MERFCFNTEPMSNIRSDGQKPVILMVREEFLEHIDALKNKIGYSDRSTLIRDAIYDLLANHGYKLEPYLKTAPGRTGKGGQPNKTINTKKLPPNAK